MQENTCICFTCKGCNNEGLLCKEEPELEDICWNCDNSKTIECSGYENAI